MTISPDGETLYIADQGCGRIFSLPTTGGEPVVLNPDLAFGETLDVAVARDDKTLFVTDTASVTVYTLAAIGGTPRVLVSGSPLIRPGALTVSPDDDLLVVVDDAAISVKGLQWSMVCLRAGDGSGRSILRSHYVFPGTVPSSPTVSH